MGKVPNWECLFVHRQQRSILVGTRGRHKNGWKNAKLKPYVEEMNETR